MAAVPGPPATVGVDEAGAVVVAAVDSGVAAPLPAHAVSATRRNEAKRMAHCAPLRAPWERRNHPPRFSISRARAITSRGAPRSIALAAAAARVSASTPRPRSSPRRATAAVSSVVTSPSTPVSHAAMAQSELALLAGEAQGRDASRVGGLAEGRPDDLEVGAGQAAGARAGEEGARLVGVHRAVRPRDGGERHEDVPSELHPSLPRQSYA